MSELGVIPLHDRVIVELSEAQEDDGILLLETSKERPNVGTVKAIGPGRYIGLTFVPTVVKVGAKVLFGKMVGFIQKINGKDYLILSETDIIAII